jgi:hypothetical protein
MFAFVQQGCRDAVIRTAEMNNVVVPAEVNVFLRSSVRVMVVAGLLPVSLVLGGWCPLNEGGR